MRDKLQERLCYTVLQSLKANVQRQYKTRKKIVFTLQLPRVTNIRFLLTKSVYNQ